MDKIYNLHNHSLVWLSCSIDSGHFNKNDTSYPVIYTVYTCKYCNSEVKLFGHSSPLDLIPDCISDDEKVIKDILE